MNKIFAIFLMVWMPYVTNAQGDKKVYLDELDFTHVENGWSYPRINKNFRNGPLKLSGVLMKRGVCVHAFSTAQVLLKKGSKRFHAIIGIEDTQSRLGGNAVEVVLIGDEKILLNVGVMQPTDHSKVIDLDITGINMLELIVKGVGGTHHSHFTWGEAYFEVTGEKPVMYTRPTEPAVILTPKTSPKPRINGAKVFGVRPGSPFMFQIAATGQKPMTYEVKNLPAGLSLDAATGLITGKLAQKGEFITTVIASNKMGKAERKFTIKCGDLLALTPPMGWNSWNCWGMAVDAKKVKSSVDFMVSKGLVEHGWTYINIDDGWQGPNRDTVTGEILTDQEKFPDMKGLSDYVHSKGLKFGIYSSPGSLTCGKRLGSLQHEDLDAATYTKWGVDYLKHDWCSYSEIYKKPSLYELKLPYQIMKKALRSQKRDIVYSLCQYGMGDVWKWGHEVDANAWRTTGDIIDTWNSMRVIGFDQDKNSAYAKPGRWNDPDMLVIGNVGWGPNLHPTHLTPNEQYTHISLWSLLSSPLLLGCDLSALDDFTLNLLTNDEVIDINQDPLGNQARKISGDDNFQIWMKDMEDGSKAVGLFNLSINPKKYELVLKQLGLEGKYTIRDVWQQKDIATGKGKIATQIPFHGVLLLKISKI